MRSAAALKRHNFNRANNAAMQGWTPASVGCFFGSLSIRSSFSITFFALFLLLLNTPLLRSQAAPSATSGPIAIVPLDSENPESAASVTGAMEVTQGKAMIGVSGTVTSGRRTTEVILPHRGLLRVCAATTVKLAADSSVPAGEVPGLMMAMNHGAVEASFATGRNADILMTPDFRILIAGPGAANVKVRLGEHGDTCVDNAAAAGGRSSSKTSGNDPYVLVTGIFSSGDYRVQPGQRVMFEHGNLHEVVDNEKEPCGCPPATATGNEFPLAQSEGLAPGPAVTGENGQSLPADSLVYSSPALAAPPADEATSTAAKPKAAKHAGKKKSGFFASISSFFRWLFGAE
ncbi:MAG: hypothetical protein WCA21_05970 [Terracidiphilus sp.]